MERERGAIVVALPSVMGDVRAAIRDAGTLYGAAAVQPAARAFAGRGRAYHMMTADGAVVVRHYLRGGAAARVLTDEYARVGTARPLRELEASVAARACGVATPEVVASVVYPAGAVYRADIATRYIALSTHLADVTLSEQRLDAQTRFEAWRAAGNLLRSAFDAGVHHADLNMRNILIRVAEDGAVGALLLDLDRAVVRPHAVRTDARRAMLDRLHRSRRKLEQAAAYATPPSELDAFNAALRGK
ncbi:MAG TPA: lipopolysaccharide kinase InaA family protein [Longimicrobiales bacterium]|nr:lipopolysaccharide kinase InaA family protein [Longimicrobiales bacterium]